MQKLSLYWFIAVFNLTAIAQDTTLTIYFKSGQSSLSPSQQGSIDKLKSRPITKITVDGFADTVGKSSFNKKLSHKRAETTAKSIKAKNKTIIGNGESKEKKVSLNKMRKVVVKVWYDNPAMEIEEIADVKIKSNDLCTDDTTIKTESGSMIKMNKCYYLKIKDCFSYKEYLTATSVQEAGLMTVDERDNPIESGGMIDIQFCSDTCIKNPITVFLPVPACLKSQPMTLWTFRNNRWVNSRNKIEFVTINGKDFYKIEVYCPGRLNCDKPRSSKRKVRVKLKNGLKYKTASISYNCPLYSNKAKIRKKKTVAVFPYVCPQEDPLFYAKVYNKNGDTLIINNKNINQYKKRRRLNNACICGDRSNEKVMGLNVRKKYLYRKYKIYKKDFSPTN